MIRRGVFLGIALALLTACHRSDGGVDEQVTTLGNTEVTGQLVEVLGDFPANDLYDYVYVFKYKVQKVHRGKVTTPEIFVGQYNPLKPRATVADDRSGKIGGHVERFHAGDVHRMALIEPLDQQWMGGVVDKYFEQKGTRYWALWTNPGEK